MWNSFVTDQSDSVVGGVTTYVAGNGDTIHTYIARPEGPGPFPGIVVLHHAPGWDELTRETANRFAAHGYTAFAPDMYCRFGHGTPDDMAARARAAGGVADAQVVADADAALQYLKSLPTSNGKVGITGMCSAGRLSVLVASSGPEFDALVDLWGGNVVQTNLSENMPVAPIDLTPQLRAPIMGIFGNDDMGPSPAQVDQHEAALIANGKTYVFHRYDGAGHAIFAYDRPSYRPQQAMDAWNKIFGFFDQYLKGS